MAVATTKELSPAKYGVLSLMANGCYIEALGDFQARARLFNEGLMVGLKPTPAGFLSLLKEGYIEKDIANSSKWNRHYYKISELGLKAVKEAKRTN
jgi:hypothetical protein